MSTANNPNSSNNDVVVTKSGGAGGGDPSVNISGRAPHAAGKAAQSAPPAKVVAGPGDAAGLGAPSEAALLLPKNGETPTRIARRKKKEEEEQQADRSADSAVAESGDSVDPAATLSDDVLLLAQADTGGGAGTAATGGGATASGTGSAAGTGAAAGTEAAGATATTAAGMSTAGMLAVAAVAVGVAAGAGGGGGSTSSTPAPAPGPDTTAPVIQSMSAQAGAVVLTYNEALDTVNVPVPGDFAVTVNGVPNAVTGVAVGGVGNTKLILTLTVPVVTGDTVNVTYTDPTGANDVAAIQDAAGNDAIGFTTGVVADGYIRGAQIYIDTNNNGLAEAGEALAGVVTNGNGNFILPAGTPAGVILATGGVNIDTGVPNTMVFKAPAGSTVISPLTTLVQTMIAQNPGTSVATASAAVVTALGLAGGTDLTTYDPLAALAANAGDAAALTIQKAAAQIATLVDLASDAPAVGSTSTQTAAAVISNIVTQIGDPTAPTVISLTDVAVITAALGTVSTASAATIDTQLTTIDTAVNLGAVTNAQAAALDTTPPAAPTSLTLTGTVSDTGTTGDNMTNDSTPVVRVNFNSTATDGTAAVIGNTVKVYEAATQVGTATLTATDVANGYIDVTLTTVLAGDGSHSLTAKIDDIVPNTSAASTAYTLALDTVAPTTAPTVALTSDTGSSSSDGITKVGTLVVGGIGAGNTAQYSIDGGTTWTSSFTAAAGVNNVDVRQIDAAGNGSPTASLTFTYDTTIATPTVSLTTNSGSTTDSISNSAALTLSATAGDVTRSITINGGTASGTYTAPTTDGSYTVVVTDTDTAGNTANATLSFTRDTTNPVFTSATTANFAENGTGTAYTAAASDTNLITSYAISGGADAALFNINATTGVVSFATAPNFEAPADAGGDNVYNLTIAATDGAGNTTAAHAVAITVTNANEAPTLTSGATASFAENAAGTVYTVTATDPDAGASLSYALGGTDAARFAINSSSGAVTFATTPNFEAATDSGADNVYNITVTASDGTNTTAAQAVAITVTNVNETPVITSAASTNFAENGTGTAYTVTATDPDAATTLSYALGGTDAALFSINAGSGVVTFATAPNREAPADAGANNVYDITVTASDGSITTAAHAVAITVTNVNEAPTSTAVTSVPAVVNQAYSFNASGNFADVDAGDSLSYAATGLPSGLAINSGTGIISGTATTQALTNAVTVTATDGGGLTTSQSFNLAVVTAPVVTALAANVAQAKSGDALTLTATLSEAVTVTGTPTLTFDVGGTAMTATYTGGDGTASLTFTATTSAGDDTSVAVSAFSLGGGAIMGNVSNQAMVTPVGTAVASFIIDNSNPVFTSATTANFAENGTGTAYATATTDATTLVYTKGGADAALFNINSSTGAVSFATAPNFEAPADVGTDNVYDITVTATDALGHASNHNVAITVTNANEAPTLTSGATASFAENAAGTVYTVTATDPDAGASLSYALGGTDAARFAINSSSGAVTFATTPNFEAATDSGADNVYNITVTASDGTNTTAAQAVAITVTNVNETPVITSAASTNFAENGTGTAYTVTATDPDAATTLSYALGGTDAALFSINAGSGVVTFATAPNREAPADAGADNVYGITVTASDGSITTAAHAVAITVTNVNEVPTLTSGATSSAVLVVDQAHSSNVSGLFSDVDAGDTLTYSATGLPAWMTLTSSTGALSGTPPATGTAEVVFTATDAGGLAVSHTVTVNVVTAPTISSSIDNVTNLDVTSNIVLTATENVTAVAAKYIHIINDGGTGFHGEAIVNTQDILVTDTTKVTIVNNTITINPSFDLDFNNDYHIMIDAGAFLGVSSGQGSVATADAAAMNFATVTPGSAAGGVAGAVASQKMDGSDAMVGSYSWWDIETLGSTVTGSVSGDLGSGNIAAVFKDYDPLPGDANAGYTGIGSPGDDYISLLNFGAGDLLYIDNQTNTAANDLAQTAILHSGTAPVQLQFDGFTPNGGQPIWVDITTTQGTSAFDSVAALTTLLQITTYVPIASA
ncbi:putative Ig domain-containing protein [Sulfuritalea sp.]|uniref:putative Ig domain-containing protein n=1 Tax=Sulfuritalea sp. TaxID=2480090 RepID=UPI00286E7047|nr:putative Ig domain-containing protein [Sulfuritalea sp.]